MSFSTVSPKIPKWGVLANLNDDQICTFIIYEGMYVSSGTFPQYFCLIQLCNLGCGDGGEL